VVVPAGITSTSWPKVAAILAMLGIVFDEWQVGLGKLVMARRADGLRAADTIVISIPRQVGKTFVFGCLLFAICLLRPNQTILWTAHRFKTARETFRSMKAMAEQERFAPFVKQIVNGSGDEAIVFHNGSRILFGARERGFGRGFAQVDGIIFDEAQILSENAVDDMVPATNQAHDPLIVYTGTPPRPIDDGAIFTELRREALTGEVDATLFVEMSADEDADPMDRRQWRKANASFPLRTTERAIMRMWKNLSQGSFLREALGIWDKDSAARIMPSWPTRARLELRGGRPSGLTLGLAGSPDGAWGSIAACGRSEDGLLVVGAVERREGQSWLVAEAVRLQRLYGYEIVLDGGGPLSDLCDDLDAEGARFTALGQGEYVDACQAMWRDVDAGTILHPDHPTLTAAVKAATWRKVGDRRAFGRGSGDISMLEAATIAAHHERLASGFNIW